MFKTQLAIALCVLSSGSAHAVSVSPAAIVYTGNEETGVLNIDNSEGTTAVTYRISALEVTVSGGTQVRTQSDKIRFAPALVTVQPGKSQAVRFLRGDLGATEQVYRVKMTQQLDPALKTVQTPVHQDLSWIWRPEGAQPRLSARWDSNGWTVSNTGNATAQLVSPTAGGKVVPGLLDYVLPGETRTFKLDLPREVVRATVNGKITEITDK